MSLKWRKILIVVGIVLLLGLALHQYLWGMLVYHSLQNHFAPQLALQTFTITPAKEMTEETVSSVSDPLQVDSLSVPIPFVEDQQKRTANLVANDTQVIALYEPEARDIFTRINNSHPTEIISPKKGCVLLIRYSAIQACDSNYELYRAYLDLDLSDLSFFSTARQQQIFYQLMLVKNVSEPAAQITSFETAWLRGFITPIQTNTYKVVVFIDDQTSHEMLFTGFTKTAVLEVLNNISATNEI